jgi:hypothetical protein
LSPFLDLGDVGIGREGRLVDAVKVAEGYRMGFLRRRVGGWTRRRTASEVQRKLLSIEAWICQLNAGTKN